ncbi:glycosyltransferase family 2 protein [Weissella confusa]|uniref:Glycosyltransferase family 2 protein n=1 Tax=Weissella confusa TaxID=1583 RepID=A0AAE2S8X0_WEICO|nr:glycosyltransferase family 2 protein [Weissella confusa]MBJ7633568.1 glycosyltransferase family 2 protein [Weissella confusa]MBJ7646347.1 glycosyltransferase family 2 protein [Weissella confusa]TGE52234.1 hypothetical protein C6P22_07865 [Weissella confusa]
MDKVSFVITTFNRLDFLKQAIKSIYSQKNQKIEIIVVDDGSTDGTVQYLTDLNNEHNFKAIFNSGTGPATNRLDGFREVTGNYVIFMDDDDYYTDDQMLSKAIRLLSNNSRIGSVFFNAYTSYDGKSLDDSYSLNFEGLVSGEDLTESFMMRYPKPLSTFPAVFLTEKLLDAGILEMNSLNDTQIYLRSFLAGGTYYCSDFIGVYRLHGGSIGNSLKLSYIVQNLEEKIRIGNSLPGNIDKNSWLLNQLWITIGHYSAKSRTFDGVGLFKWMRILPLRVKLYLTIRVIVSRLKFKIKRISGSK